MGQYQSTVHPVARSNLTIPKCLFLKIKLAAGFGQNCRSHGSGKRNKNECKNTITLSSLFMMTSLWNELRSLLYLTLSFSVWVEQTLTICTVDETWVLVSSLPHSVQLWLTANSAGHFYQTARRLQFDHFFCISTVNCPLCLRLELHLLNMWGFDFQKQHHHFSHTEHPVGKT